MDNKEISNGAIENGRVLIDRLEQWYRFSDQSDRLLADCAEWIELKMCFEYMVDSLNK